MIEPERMSDDIDRIVDALLANPANAGDIKTILRSKLGAPDIVHVVHAAPRTQDADDVEDFWDNVPV